MKGIVFTVRRKRPEEKYKPAVDLKHRIKKYGITIMLMAFLFFGFAAGILLAKLSDISAVINGFFGLDIFTSSTADVFGVFAAHLSASFILMFLIFLFGVCAVGTPFLPFISFIKGLGIATVTATLVTQFGAKGIVFYVLTCFAGDILFIIAMFSECKRALFLSAKLGRILLFNNANVSNAGDDIKDFVVHSSYMLVLAAAAAALSTLLHFIFAGMSGML